ncbi:ABC transporter ATP-binding protein [Microvirga rosea]|uniref:ABC transporter ATP-binding protein n=1 Tax=Microvirga rosea TaxID=2715425 RepID=UPI001D0B9DE0|nr:ABC transporter ATP-binding protein [Microvirga rosea]MCB8823031.1 ABC transporter ATP-binding protein [Microvirga rosea]
MTDALLKIRALNAWYGESHILHGIDLDIRQGETVTLLGRNGAGKTTTLRAIMGILRRREGTINLAGKDLTVLPLHRVAQMGLGYVPEERGIFASLSVEENLTLPPKVAEGGMSVEEIYRLFPNLQERRNSQGTKLSGGEQQMLAIARVLRTGAKIILLDEPTEGLAPVIVQRIGDVLVALKQRGMTILLVEQNFRFARKVADRFYLMEDGRMVNSFAEHELDDHMNELHDVLGV